MIYDLGTVLAGSYIATHRVVEIIKYKLQLWKLGNTFILNITRQASLAKWVLSKCEVMWDKVR